MTGLMLAEARALRLLLAALETDREGSIDGITRVIAEADGCSDCLIDIILTLTGMLAQTINTGQHRRRGWLIYTQLRIRETPRPPRRHTTQRRAVTENIGEEWNPCR